MVTEDTRMPATTDEISKSTGPIEKLRKAQISMIYRLKLDVSHHHALKRFQSA